MIKVVAIDDEPIALKVIENFCNNIDFIELDKTFRDAKDGLKHLNKFPVDLLLLDIDMPFMNGIDLYKQLKQDTLVIFITSRTDYAVEGFNLMAVDYLVKPVSFERFFKAITKLNRLMGQETVAITNNEVHKSASFIYVKVDRDMKKIFVNDIEYIESWKDYVKIFLAGGKYLLAKQSISAMENLLSEHKFIRVHRSYMVSFDKVSGYNGASVLLAGREIPIGRLYKQVVMDRLQERR